ncbi:Universal stress protein [Lentibacillus sp. JNUCC-1]|uniref:universal stress protein n=1 Tax=Lentibacillus sp. JNUCC-1 TaxID=2654513 RepID=UPI0012E8988F|nr:universal stress protein [Lentibacillus sp. JNUCC-1]MUV38191.1 Universal stress protein [Lentibacillus sp. JNUCC-1]
MKHIVFATDGSESSDRAGEMARDYLQAWPEAKLTVLYVTARENYTYDLVSEAVDQHEAKVAEQIKANMVDHLFEAWKDRVEFVHEVGHPSSTICRVGREKDADLIIVGSHGRGFIDRAIVGSVARAVLNRTHLPVLVAR